MALLLTAPPLMIPSRHVLAVAIAALSGWLQPGVAGAAKPGLAEDWSVVSSPHFTVYTNAEVARGGEIVASLERFRAVFAQLSPEIELSSPSPTTILAFRDAESYAPYKTVADRQGARILGQFLSHPDGNYLTLDAGTRLVSGFAVIYHEYVHYFVRHNFPGVPLWFNEGLAEYYSTFSIDDEHVRVGLPVDRHLDWLRHHSELELDEVLTATSSSGRRHEAQQAGRFYAVSWALVHYLLSAETDRLDRAADFFLRLRDGEDAAEAFEDAFDQRLGALEDDLVRYVRSGELPSARVPLARLPRTEIRAWAAPPEEVLFRLGDLLAHMGRDASAERHFQLALDHRGDHADTHAGLALVREMQNRFEEAALLFADAVELGSSNALTYLLYGRHLLRRLGTAPSPGSSPEEAAALRRALAGGARGQLLRAVELDPDYGEAWALLARAHRGPGGEPELGLRAVARARELLPGRMDLVTLEVQLNLELSRLDRAEALVETVLATQADDELVAKAREMVERRRLLEAARGAFEHGDPEAGLDYFDRAISATSDPRLREAMERQLAALRTRWSQ